MPKQKVGKFARTHFAVFDYRLRAEIQNGVVPHLADTFGLGYFMGKEPATCLDHLNMYLFMVGVSELPGDNAFAVVETCQAKQQPYGVIMRTHDPAKWRRLAELRKQARIALIIAVGGPRSDFKQMFPGTPILCDITDLIIPGQKVARFIDDVVDQEKARHLEKDELPA